MAQEFQVVLLAGGTGSRMYPLTEGMPKGLLPIANRPLISYQLELLIKVGFTDGPEIKKYIQEIYKPKLKITYEIVKGRVGTAEAILKLKDKIQSDFIVISGDLIVADNFVHTLADIHRARDAAVTVLLKKPQPLPSDQPAPKPSENDQPADFIGLTDGRIVFFSSAADIEEKIKIHKSLLRVYPNLSLHKNLLDAHFYIFSRWTLDVLEKYEKEISSIKGEFIPFLVRLQLTKEDKKKAVPEHVLNVETLANTMPSSLATNKDFLGCFAYVLEEGYCMRINTVQNYLEGNRDVSRGATAYTPFEEVGKQNFVATSAQINPKTQVGPECVIGEGTKIGEKCSIKKSQIGKHCNIGHNVKLINSVIMNHVTILNGCTIQNSIICNDVHMAESCSIKDCQVGASYSFEAKVDLKGESLVPTEE